jgi:hypothetical protein
MGLTVEHILSVPFSFFKKSVRFFNPKKSKLFLFLKNFSTHDGASSFIYNAIQA